METYKPLIIGLGNQGALADAPESGNEHKIISYTHGFIKHYGFKNPIIYDHDFEKITNAFNLWGIKGTSNYLRDLEQNRVDVAVIATPDYAHYEILKELSDYPLKLVICEKPLCSNIEQTKEIVELYKTRNIPLMVNYTRRFLPYYQELKKLYDVGIFGEIQRVKLDFNRGWLHTATHGIDFFNWFFGDKITPTIRHINHEKYRVWIMSMTFQNYRWAEERIKSDPVWERYNFSHWYVAENAYNFLQGKEELMCTGEDGLKALQICYEWMVNS